MDWLSRVFEMMPVRGRLDLRCSYGAPWRIDQGPGEANEIPYHAVVGGSAVLEDPAGGKPLRLETGDILLLPGNPRHVMHDGSGSRPKPARNRPELNLVISENAGRGDRLDRHAKAGKPAERPFMNIHMQSAVDRTVAPGDMHTISIFTQYGDSNCCVSGFMRHIPLWSEKWQAKTLGF